MTEDRPMRRIVALMLLLPAAALAADESPTAAAPTPACTAPEYRQFDFWLGRWNVTSNGVLAGTNEVRAIHGGCALQENWIGAGAGGISGTSLNLYDGATGRWRQTWVDSAGTLLQLAGGLVEGAMVLEGEQPGAAGAPGIRHRISWTPSPEGTVRQVWEASHDGGNTWSRLFDGLYERAEPVE
jgi:hypothetical protein